MPHRATQELVDRINDVDPDVWNSLTPDQQQQALQYLVRGHFGLADSHSAFGDYEAAENDYSTVMFDLPSFLSADQLAYVFLQWSTLYLDWGNALFRANSVADALTQYTKLIKPDDTLPARSDGGLYGFPSLQPSMNSAAKIAQNISQLIAGLQTANSLGVNPLLAAAFLEAHQQLVKIGNSLDFWGHFHNTVPIWTFDYLQGAAGDFAQFAVNAERDFITFQERSDQGSATREQLLQLASQAGAEVDAAGAQAAAVAAEAQAYAQGADLAKQRATDAQSNADEYTQTSSQAIQLDAMRSQIAGGDGQSPDILNAIADQFTAGGKPNASDDLNPSSDLYGVYSRNNVAAGAQLASAKVSQQYEIDSLQRTADQMKSAAAQAATEAAAAQARVAAANAATAVATLHAEAAQQNLQAFQSQTFTPDVWQRMANSMFRLYRRYLDMALKTALLMQQAYNFETDQSLRIHQERLLHGRSTRPPRRGCTDGRHPELHL